jgi:hypothetical protein
MDVSDEDSEGDKSDDNDHEDEGENYFALKTSLAQLSETVSTLINPSRMDERRLSAKGKEYLETLSNQLRQKHMDERDSKSEVSAAVAVDDVQQYYQQFTRSQHLENRDSISGGSGDSIENNGNNGMSRNEGEVDEDDNITRFSIHSENRLRHPVRAKMFWRRSSRSRSPLAENRVNCRNDNDPLASNADDNDHVENSSILDPSPSLLLSGTTSSATESNPIEIASPPARQRSASVFSRLSQFLKMPSMPKMNMGSSFLKQQNGEPTNDLEKVTLLYLDSLDASVLNA